jgi:hypothetical protein
VKFYLDQVFKLAWKDGNPENETNVIKFNLTRPVTSGTGQISKQTIEVEAPLLSLVPVPAFTMQEATVQFTMEVKTSETSKEEAGFKVGGSYWGATAEVSGSVTNTSENTRSSDQSAKYDIFAKAVQQPPAEGMAKLTQIFASVIEPINVGGGS